MPLCARISDPRRPGLSRFAIISTFKPAMTRYHEQRASGFFSTCTPYDVDFRDCEDGFRGRDILGDLGIPPYLRYIQRIVAMYILASLTRCLQTHPHQQLFKIDSLIVSHSILVNTMTEGNLDVQAACADVWKSFCYLFPDSLSQVTNVTQVDISFLVDEDLGPRGHCCDDAMSSGRRQRWGPHGHWLAVNKQKQCKR
ncbi:hypothetical protein OG21DRAFT_585525 [Imleria badia]|nr:hypothetical protein OG21DRAFT_585525 [Imleria badia]